MGYVKPEQVIESMVQAGAMKAALSIKDVLIRSALAGAFISYAVTLAMTASIQTGMGIVGALVFPVGFVMVVLLGMELVTGNFALIPLAVYEKKATMGQMWSNWGWVFLGHVIGCFLYVVLYFISFRFAADQSVIEQIVKTAEMKTTGYAALGGAGLASVFVKAILCNWMVALAVVMGMTAESVIGKIAAMWLPIFIFFAQGFEHSVVNLFVIPAGMMFGADVSIADWWFWNQMPVTFGNIVGGALFTGVAMYMTHKKKRNVSSVSIEKNGTE
ncbi:formate/nitrite transporter family protein [Domibacillus mangrovi]|uniref:Formate transporter n=1 Tax=Domibacillus mangrovi TaxID=1714354 RepID=A0A1Q5P249_9BACI|nr:formate/nitrite transporter family protein [Domibacillus mangrovi]OKL36251.1 formate transporter [Domibacillus mangrovi]